MRTSPHKRRRGFTLIDTLVVGGCLLIVLALLTPAIVAARSSARRSMCKNNLKQIALALLNYEETYRTFPPGWVSRHPFPMRSYGYGWMVRILPYVEQARLFNRIDFQRPLPDANYLLQTKIDTYRCPSDRTPAVNPLRSNYGTSNYSGNAGTSFRGQPQSVLTHWLSPRRARYWPGQRLLNWGFRRPNGLFWLNSSVRVRDVTDGLSNTFIVGERSAKSGAGIWAGVASNELVNDVVTDCSPGNELNSRDTAFSSYHDGGAHFAFCDGHVRFIKNSIDPRIYRILSGRDDGQPIPDF